MFSNPFATAAALAMRYYGAPAPGPSITLNSTATVADAPLKRYVQRARFVSGIGTVYPGGSVPGGLRRRQERGSATYTGPLHAFMPLPGGRMRPVPLYGERGIVQPGSRASTVRVQFNTRELVKHVIHDEYVSLGLGWHEFPRNHFRFDRTIPWH